MRRSIPAIVLALFAAPVAALAQAPAEPAGPPRLIRGEARIQYIGKRLDLNKEQQQHWDSLLEVYRVTVEDEKRRAADVLQEIRSLMTDLADAQKNNDTAREKKIREEIGQRRPGVRAEQEMLDNMASHLDAGQKDLLKVLRERLDKNKAGDAVTVADVLQLANAQQLTPEQSPKITKLEEDLRTKMAGPNPPNRDEALQQLIKDVRAVLTPDQTKRFDRLLAAFKPDAPPKVEAPDPHAGHSHATPAPPVAAPVAAPTAPPTTQGSEKKPG